ncbi:MAG: hypothetical protein ABIQ15_14385 [Nocardioides sp.]
MAPPKIRVLMSSLALVGTATITAGTAAAAQSAEATLPTAVSISKTRVITMPATLQPGVNEFTITSTAKGGSGFQLARPAAGYTTDEANRDIEKAFNQEKIRQLKRFEANVTLLGGVTADDTADTLVVDLDPGTYWALDTNANKAVKFFTFTVAGLDTGNVMPAATTIRAKAARTWAGSPKAIPNKGVLNFKNTSSNNHFVVLVKLKKGKTYQDFKKWFAAAQGGPSGPPPVNFDIGLDSGVVSPGHAAEFSYRLPKGDYVMLCFWPDASMGGTPHAFMGMHRAITLK